MTKRIVEAPFPDSNWQDALQDKTVGDAIRYLRQYPLNAVLCYEYGHELSTYGEVRISREETDEEYAARTAKEQAQKLAQEERDRAEFMRLQAKFGGPK